MKPCRALLAVAACHHTPPATTVPLPHGFRPIAIAAADFDGDGRIDVAVCGEGGALVIVDGARRVVASDASCGANPIHMIAADLDGDGRPDLAVANHDTDYITTLHDTARGFVSERVHVHSKPHPHTVAAADVDGDGAIDLVTDSWGENRLVLLPGGRGPGTPIEAGRKPYVNVVAADLDGDGHVDLAFPSAGSTAVTVLYGPGFTGDPIVAGPAPFMIAAADLDGDGRLDLAVLDYSGHMSDSTPDGLTWIRNDGGRQLTAFPERLVVGHGSWSIATGDVDGDGVADVAFTNAADGTISLAYGGPGGPRSGPTVPVMPDPHWLAIGGGSVFVITEDRDEVWIVSGCSIRQGSGRSTECTSE